MKIGAFFNWQNHTDWDRYIAKESGAPSVPDAQIYDEEIYLGELLEPLGYDSYWSIDHYVTPYGMTGGALQNLTYFAGKTTKLEMGTMVTVLPWYEPVHLAHEISVLDNLLQGRQLTLGLGRGAAVREFDAFGIPMNESRGRYNEVLEVLKKALTQEWFSHDGEFFKIPETSVRPMFRNPERIMQRLRVAWTSPETLPIAAHGGLGMLMTNQKSWPDYREDVRGFNAIRAEHGWAPTQPTVVVRAACFDTDAEAWDVMSKYTLEGQLSSTLHYQFADTARFQNTKGYEQYAKLREHVRTKEENLDFMARPQAWGTPDRVLQQLLHIQQMTSAEEFVISFRFGTMSVETAERSMRLFAQEVLPHLHKYQAGINNELPEPSETSSTQTTPFAV